MKLSNELIAHLGLLSRLELSDQDVNEMQDKLQSILGYIERIQNIDTNNVPPFTISSKDKGWRDDIDLETDDLTRELILENFPDRVNNLLNTPGVFKNSK